MTVRTTGGGGSEKEIAIISQQWRELGIDVVEEVLAEALATNQEVRAKFATFETTSVIGGDQALGRWDSRIAPTPERRFSGNNRGSYMNPALDRIITTLQATLDEGEQARLMREGSELVATDLPAMPLYFGIRAAAIKRGVRALDDFGGTTIYGTTLSRNAHLWDRD
jgi:ABC-type transport system substrate-binding protein